MVNDLMCKVIEIYKTNLVFNKNSKEFSLTLYNKYGLWTKCGLCSCHLFNW